jgi:hypothetical protein
MATRGAKKKKPKKAAAKGKLWCRISGIISQGSSVLYLIADKPHDIKQR